MVEVGRSPPWPIGSSASGYDNEDDEEFYGKTYNFF